MKSKKWIVVFVLLVVAIGSSIGLYRMNTNTPVSTSQQSSNKSIVLYFDYSNNIDTKGLDVDTISSASLHGEDNGNTKNLVLMVNEIKEKKNADVFPIEINEVYPADFDERAPIARDDIEQGTNFTFKEMPKNLDQYDVVYVGSPKMEYSL